MTSVVGILNKRGAAIAADSAVTRQRSRNGDRREKVTKNGNKMVRLSNVDPVAVMITGNADFLRIPWDVLVRRYRQRRGAMHHPTVEAHVRDFFDYIASDDAFWNSKPCTRFLRHVGKEVFMEAMDEMFDENDRNEDGTMMHPNEFVQAFSDSLSRIAQERLNEGGSPHFESYPLEEFRHDAAEALDVFFNRLADNSARNAPEETFPREVLDAVRPSFEAALLAAMGARRDTDGSATLVFVGYGENQEYPSLVPAVVCDGFAHRVNFSILPEDVICISDERPVAICPFAQDDVIKAILQGIHESWSNNVLEELDRMTDASSPEMLDTLPEDEDPGYIFADLFEVNVEDLKQQFYKEGYELMQNNQRQWEKALERYGAEEMADLADCLVDLTGLHRVLTFSQEGVGGIVDLATITREEGFSWLRRKGWYHKDNRGKDGSFGI